MTGLDPRQLRILVIRPALQAIGLWSTEAEDLVWGTAVQESELRFLAQHKSGPAQGLWQMEPRTARDIWNNHLKFNSDQEDAMWGLLAETPNVMRQLSTNLCYGAAMCRIHYYRVPTPLPAAGEIEDYARYWKDHYNTPLGKGTTKQFVKAYYDASQ